MTLADILAKIAKGETLNDEEKSFAGSYDLQKQLDAAAGAARKKAEKERDDAKSEAVKLMEQIEELKNASNDDKHKAEKASLEKRLATLEKAKADAEARTAKLTRDARVRELAKAAGIVAAKGIDSKTLDAVIDGVMQSVDLEDAEAVKTALDGFKTANAGMIAAQTIGGANPLGNPGGGFTGANPWKKDSFNLTTQMRLQKESPETAKALQAEAQNQ